MRSQINRLIVILKNPNNLVLFRFFIWIVFLDEAKSMKHYFKPEIYFALNQISQTQFKSLI